VYCTCRCDVRARRLIILIIVIVTVGQLARVQTTLVRLHTPTVPPIKKRSERVTKRPF